MPRRRRQQPIEERGDGVVWAGLVANAQGIDPGELLIRELLAQALVAGTLDLTAYLGEASE
jgi:hypothetical protein